MSDEKGTKLSQDDLKQVPGAVELSLEDLNKVAGGAVNQFLKIDGIPGESTDDKHKDE
jgi:hypothetical protein